MAMAKTPVDAGFKMPGEWATHARTWMAWPAHAALWNGFEHEAKLAFTAVAQAISQFEPVTMVVNPSDLAEAGRYLGTGISLLPVPIDDSWMRDSGPTFLVDAAGRVAGADWRFNAWGGKWPYEKDAAVAASVLQDQGIYGFSAPFVLEGGSIHVDGEGTVITTEQCLLNPNRNPTLSKGEIEAHLKAWLGVETVVWLGEGLENDHTDGHVDDITCFVRPGVVMTTVTDDRNDANYRPMQDNLARLRAARDARGRAFEIIEMPLPARRDTAAGRLVLTYINYYLANGAVIAPAFDDPMDAVARDILVRAFPDRTVVQIPALAILEGGGGIHCITQQQPLGLPMTMLSFARG